jgi:hypothetical protein
LDCYWEKTLWIGEKCAREVAIIIIIMRFFVVGALFVVIAASSASSSSPSKRLFGIIPSASARSRKHSWIIQRGGGADDTNDIINIDDSEQQQQPAYHPGLLDAVVPPSSDDSEITASSDYRLCISPSKAKELNVKSGDLVAIIGKRRRASYAKVNILPKGATTKEAKLSRNLASNLRLRTMDKVKIVPLSSKNNGEENDEDEECESKSYSLGNTPTSTIAQTITLHPLKDSLTSLDYKEGGGGDGLSDEEVLERFITPYLNLEEDEEGGVFLNGGHILTLKDENGLNLEFKVGHLELEGDEEGALSFPVDARPLLTTFFMCLTHSTHFAHKITIFLLSRNGIRRHFHEHLGYDQLLHPNHHRSTRRSGRGWPWL